jgi:flagellar biosynthetic protein FliR
MINLWLFVLVFVRTASFIALFPPWAGRALPQTVKVGLAGALALFWATSGEIGSEITPPSGLLEMTAMGIRETIIGAVLGQVVGLVLIPPRIAGSYIAQEMGLTFAALTSPIDQHPSDVVAQIFEVLALGLFFVLDGHHFILRVLDASWRSSPCGSTWPTPLWARSAMASVGTVEAGLAIAASVGVLMMMVTVWLALASRMAPQMHLFAWGMSVRVLIGLGALIVYLPELLMACSRALLSRQGLFLLR